jgi:hypothetical protein
MTYSRREKICAAAAVVAAGIVAGMGACTPATVDQPVGAAGSSSPTAGASPSTSGGPAASAGTGTSAGAPGSAGATPAGGGAAGSDPVGAGGSSAPSGGAPPGNGGAGGTVAAGGSTVGAAGAVAAGGATSGAIGCGWVKAASGLWSMNPPAADKQVLYNGTDKGLNQWHKLNEPNTPAQWTVIADGSLEVVPATIPTNIQSNAKFDDVCLHVEYLNAAFATTEPDVQKHGNSGVYLKSAYEMQVLDTHDIGPIYDGCGAVYKVMAPMVVACKMRPAWNVYEIEFKGSLWNSAGAKIKNAVFVQVALNGQLVQQNVTLNPSAGFTEAGIPDVAGPQPVALQDHREPDDYRNIWAAVPRY